MSATGLVLAAGSSERLGQPKQLLRYGDGTLLGHVLDTARACAFDQLICVLGADAAAHRAVMEVKSREVGGSGYANATVAFSLAEGGGTIQTTAQITGKAASMGEGVVIGVLDALITSFAAKLGN